MRWRNRTQTDHKSEFISLQVTVAKARREVCCRNVGSEAEAEVEA